MSQLNPNPHFLTGEKSLYLPYPCYFLIDSSDKNFKSLRDFIREHYTITKTLGNYDVFDDLKISIPNNPSVYVYARSCFMESLTNIFAYICIYSKEENENVAKFRDYLDSFAEKLSFGIFDYDSRMKCYYKTSKQLTFSEMIGIDDIVNKIENDIHALNNCSDRMRRMGMNPGKNYLLTGPPGTGKTSLVKEIARRFKFPLLLGNIEKAEDICTELYNPLSLFGCNNVFEIGDDGVIIAVFEDCDRYISNDKNTMAILLNSLEGIAASKKILRFFTVNDPSCFVGCEAFINRISRKFEFTLPKQDLLKQYLLKHFDNSNMLLIDTFSKLAADANLSYRLFVNYISRYIDSESDTEILKLCIGNMDNYASEVKSLNPEDMVLSKNSDNTNYRKPTTIIGYSNTFYSA